MNTIEKISLIIIGLTVITLSLLSYYQSFTITWQVATLIPMGAYLISIGLFINNSNKK